MLASLLARAPLLLRRSGASDGGCFNLIRQISSDCSMFVNKDDLCCGVSLACRALTLRRAVASEPGTASEPGSAVDSEATPRLDPLDLCAYVRALFKAPLPVRHPKLQWEAVFTRH